MFSNLWLFGRRWMKIFLFIKFNLAFKWKSNFDLHCLPIKLCSRVPRPPKAVAVGIFCSFSIPCNLGIFSNFSFFSAAEVCPDKLATTKMGFYLMLRWVSAKWITKKFFPLLKKVFYDEARPRLELQSVKNLFGKFSRCAFFFLKFRVENKS